MPFPELLSHSLAVGHWFAVLGLISYELVCFDSDQVQVLCDSKAGLADEQGEPWFVAKDVCQVLDIVKTDRAVAALDVVILTSSLTHGQNKHVTP